MTLNLNLSRVKTGFKTTFKKNSGLDIPIFNGAVGSKLTSIMNSAI